MGWNIRIPSVRARDGDKAKSATNAMLANSVNFVADLCWLLIFYNCELFLTPG